ncbi:hypothetical protein N9J35_00270 [bacterium]|nr:hypothetical protein [bacterium]
MSKLSDSHWFDRRTSAVRRDGVQGIRQTVRHLDVEPREVARLH